MITSSGHYLHPEYLPLPTTLDSKQSPLALLAQTCNSIGKDPSSTKSGLVSHMEKKDSSQKDKDSTKGSPALKTEEKTTAGGESRSSPKQRDSEDVKMTLSSPPRQNSPSGGETRTQSSPNRVKATSSPPPVSKSGAGDTRSSSSPGRKTSTPSLSLHSNSKISLSCGSVSVEVKHQESVTASKSMPQVPSAHPSYADAIAHGTPLHSLPGSYHAGLSMLGHMDPASAAAAAAAYYGYVNLPAHAGYGLGSLGQKGAGAGAGPSPYLQYTSVKTPSGTTLVPVCKDPYCNQCQSSARSAHLGASCSPGCTQCTTPTSVHAPTPLAQAGLTSHQSLLSSLYPHHPLSALGQQHSMPYACNWLGQGSEFCGKRFSSSEELMIHLRSHTSLSSLPDVTSSLPSALPYPNLGLTTAAAAAHGLQLHYPTSLSPNSLRHAYGRSVSPNGLSALAASRYHPYKSPLSALTQPPHAALPGGLPSHLSPYYLPYSMYGQRLGAAMTP